MLRRGQIHLVDDRNPCRRGGLDPDTCATGNFAINGGVCAYIRVEAGKCLLLSRKPWLRIQLNEISQGTNARLATEVSAGVWAQIIHGSDKSHRPLQGSYAFNERKGEYLVVPAPPQHATINPSARLRRTKLSVPK
jgi:hypothetical protein